MLLLGSPTCHTRHAGYKQAGEGTLSGHTTVTGPRTGALCWGPEEPGLYAMMASRDAGSQLLLLTVGR